MKPKLHAAGQQSGLRSALTAAPAAAAFLFAVVTAAVLPAANADLILYNGKIVTVDEKFSLAEALSIKNGKITKVGTTRQVFSTERGPRTLRIDLNGRTVLPGLIDSHVHPIEAGLSELDRQGGHNPAGFFDRARPANPAYRSQWPHGAAGADR